MRNKLCEELSENFVWSFEPHLTPIQVQVLLSRIKNVTLQNLADSLNLSKERVRQIQFQGRNNILKSLDRLFSLEEWETQMSYFKSKSKDDQEVARNLLDIDIDILKLPLRAEKALRKAGIIDLYSLLEKTEFDIQKLKNIGKVSLKAIKNSLIDFGLKLSVSGSSDIQITRTRVLKSVEIPIDIITKSVFDLELTVRTANVLKHLEVRKGLNMTIGHLVQMTESELLNERNFGRVSLRNIREELSKYGADLNMKVILRPNIS
jgi:DNA-directed RNA polymerase alpha subunit